MLKSFKNLKLSPRSARQKLPKNLLKTSARTTFCKRKFFNLYHAMKKLLFLIIAILIVILSFAGYIIYTQKSRSSLDYSLPSDYSTRRIYAQPISKSNLPEWQNAEAKWNLFAEEHMERMRKIDGETPRAKLPDYKFDGEWFEIKHPLISKYLPDYRIYSEKYFTFALSKTGQIIAIETTWPGGTPYKSAPDFETKSFSNFISELLIPVDNKQSAIEFAQLKLVVDGGNGYPTYSDYPYWEFKSSRNGSVWIVRIDYIGDPFASIIVPPYWEIVVDGQNHVKEIIKKRSDF